jgi:hypothetical protein
MFSPFLTIFVDCPVIVGPCTATQMSPQTVFNTSGINIWCISFFHWGKKLPASNLACRPTWFKLNFGVDAQKYSLLIICSIYIYQANKITKTVCHLV